MIEKRFKLSKYATPSSVSYFCDENGRMLNKEVVKVLNEQQDTIIKLGQRDYYNQSERYKILSMAIELTINYIANSYEEHYDIGALITEFEEELLDNGR